MIFFEVSNENHLKPFEEKCLVSSKAGYLFMNRAAVDEEDKCEILKIFELEKASEEMWYFDSEDSEYENSATQRNQKGTVSFDQHNDMISNSS